MEEILCIVINSHSISVRVFYSHFTDEEIEAQKDKMAGPVKHGEVGIQI